MRLYPTWEQLSKLKNPLTDGERSLIRFLNDNLPKDLSWTSGKALADYKGWLIFVQPFLNGSRPDVVIYHPFVGVIIYEVKDWQLIHYSWDKDADNRTTLFVNDGAGRYPVKSPIKQVEHYKEKIIGQLVPRIGEVIDAEQRNFGLIKTGIYFHKSPTEKARALFGSAIKNVAYFPIIGYDYLQQFRLQEIIPDVKYSSSRYWNRNWNEELLFWLHPPFHSIEQGEKLNLKGNQIKIAEPKSGHHRVRGVAGSGKTQALAYRAGKLASMNCNVLIITFNITLWHYVKDMIARSPFNFRWDQITFNHFHGFCKDKLNEFGVPWPYSEGSSEESLDEFFRSTVPETVKEAIVGKNYQRYDAILIDEGQDYHIEWYELLSQYFLSTRDELLLVSDKRQNIYDRELDWQDKRVSSNKAHLTKFREDFIRLYETFRLPKRVAEMSNEFSETFGLDQELKVSRIQDMPSLIHSQHIVWINIEQEQWLEYVFNSFLRLKRETYSPSDMVMLLPSHKYGKECVQFFKEKNVEVNHVFENEEEAKFHPHKKAFWMGDGRLKMSTIHSFKGWELLNIVLYIPKKAPESNNRLDAIVYTAITRTRENLIVLNSHRRYDEFGDRFPKKWNEQNFT